MAAVAIGVAATSRPTATRTRLTVRRAISQATTTRPAMSSNGSGPSDPNGAAAAQRATSAIHPTNSRVGRCSRAAADPPSSPAGIPATSGLHRRAIALEAMPPNERRIVHIALADSKDISTESIGEGEARRVSRSDCLRFKSA